jgi:hypothetical protein
MPLIDRLTGHLADAGNPYPALNLLEASLAWSRTHARSPLPAELISDLEAMFGARVVQAEAQTLVDMGALQAAAAGFGLHPQACEPVLRIVDAYREQMRLALDGPDATAGEFALRLAGYLAKQVPGVEVFASRRCRRGAVHEFAWQGARYRLQTAISFVWLPAVVAELVEEKVYLALLGPFSAQRWQILHKYYVHPQFRRLTACFDPWTRQKMNVSRGGLFVYLDWFFRDAYGLKFKIPPDFSLALQHLGLLRFNDER